MKAIFDDEEYPVIVKFRANNARYTADRRWSLPHQPTLSDEPYEIPIKINKAPEWSPQEWEVALFRDEKGKPWVAERLERITESGQFLCYSGTLYRQARPFAQHLIGMAENPPFTPESIGTFAQGGLVNPLNTAPCRVRIPAKSDPTGATPDRPAN